MKKTAIILAAALIFLAAAGCSRISDTDTISHDGGAQTALTEQTDTIEVSQDTGNNTDSGTSVTVTDDTEEITAVANVTSGGIIDATDLFTERDLKQTADTSSAVFLELSDNTGITISEAGVYVISGSASEATVTVDAGDEDKVQLVLDGVNVTNSDFPVIYVKNADKVFVTTLSTESVLSVTGSFRADGTTNTDAVIFSKDDLVINGTGILTINSTAHGITGKDDIKITGSSVYVTSGSSAIQANDTIAVADGVLTISSKTDGLHAENDSDSTEGNIYICGGEITVTAGDDGIHAVAAVQIDGGDIAVTAAEGIEATYVQINGGSIGISASDDGINGAKKSSLYTPTVEINGGYTVITMGQGDTDGVDSNGYIYVNGGTLDITGQSAFDYDMGGVYSGGTIIVNGTVTNTITNQFGGGMGFGGQGGFGGPGGRR